MISAGAGALMCCWEQATPQPTCRAFSTGSSAATASRDGFGLTLMAGRKSLKHQGLAIAMSVARDCCGGSTR